MKPQKLQDYALDCIVNFGRIEGHKIIIELPHGFDPEYVYDAMLECLGGY
jgi:hypothetical protein